MAIEHYGDECLHDWGIWYSRANDKTNPHDKSGVNVIHRLMLEAKGSRYIEPSRSSEPLSEVQCELVDGLVMDMPELNKAILLHFYPIDMSVHQIAGLISEARGKSISTRTVNRRLRECRVFVGREIQAATAPA